MLGEGVAELGGLHVIGTERHESRRIDNQLKGRAGRQGDPGSSQFFISLEDDMFRRFAKEETEKLKPKLKTDETGRIINSNIHEFVDKVQRIIEGLNFSIREYNLKLDDVINEQRNVVYHIRDKVLKVEDRISLIVPMVQSACSNIVEKYCLPELIPEEWDVKTMTEELNRLLYPQQVSFEHSLEDMEDVKQKVKEAVDSYIQYLETWKNNLSLQTALKNIMLTVIDQNWMKHLENMALLKEGIGLRHYQQEDPMRLYQKDGFELFTMMYATIEKEMSLHLSQLLQSFQHTSDE
ncbi:hypothetical protein B4119_3633 [Parageobacillus caldoxylosilyticus]|uniref:SecA family profile domain-containing protein n=1 Tax=Saccharococcus caldoxylosilyticus TaxID=81408 RepID=A0A150LXD9_9BACL|nr:hypothetical protein B4119_3633 [Parageobacillus caldoxylosilyticus]